MFEAIRMARRRPALSISVIVSTYNRAESLARTLDGLGRQTYENFKVIVVPGPCSDGTAKLLQSHSGKIKTAYCPDTNLAVSRNIGIELAAGEVVAFIDDDAVPTESWLATLAPGYSMSSIAGVGGYVLNHRHHEPDWRICTCSRTGSVQVASSPPIESYLGIGADPFLYLPGTNMSFRRSVLVEIGGFNEALGNCYDDAEICCRIIDAGGRILVLADALVHHYLAPNSIRDDGGVIRDAYPILNSQSVFALHCRSEAVSTPDVILSLEEAAQAWRNAAARRRAEGAFTTEEYEAFELRIGDAICNGTRTGLQSRPRRQIGAADMSRFHPSYAR